MQGNKTMTDPKVVRQTRAPKRPYDPAVVRMIKQAAAEPKKEFSDLEDLCRYLGI